MRPFVADIPPGEGKGREGKRHESAPVGASGDRQAVKIGSVIGAKQAG